MTLLQHSQDSNTSDTARQWTCVGLTGVAPKVNTSMDGVEEWVMTGPEEGKFIVFIYQMSTLPKGIQDHVRGVGSKVSSQFHTVFSYLYLGSRHKNGRRPLA